MSGGAITGLGFVSRVAAIAAGAALLLVNLVVPIVAAFRRQYLALGIIVAFASVSALVVLEGVFTTVSDFVGLGVGIAISGTAGSTAAGNFAVATFVVVGVLVLVGFVIGAFLVLRRVSRSL